MMTRSNTIREWRGEDKPIQHTTHCCQLYRERGEKNQSGYFIATPRIGFNQNALNSCEFHSEVFRDFMKTRFVTDGYREESKC
jgi:hypothetical protein